MFRCQLGRVLDTAGPKSHIRSFFLLFGKPDPVSFKDPELRAFASYCLLRTVNQGATFGSVSRRDNVQALVCMEFFLNKKQDENVDVSQFLQWIKNSDRFTDEEKANFDGQWGDKQWTILREKCSRREYSELYGAAKIYSLIVLCNRGQTTPKWERKHLDLLRTECGARSDFSPVGSVVAYLHTYHVNVNEDWKTFFADMLSSASGTIAERNIILQTELAWLTAFSIVKEAKQNFPSFPWLELDKLFPAEKDALAELEKKVAANKYFGFTPEARLLGSTKFPHVFYIAKTLMIEYGGNWSLKGYAGAPNMTDRGLCDKLVKWFAPVYRAQTAAAFAKAALKEAEAKSGKAV
uniref:Uncharacterized protein n=1 Tax=Trichuris muris TaxID=70415 RepID=A0A5S6R0Z3_TRIMR